MKKFGIDISHWQGDFNFKAAKAEGVEFAIIKGGGGDGGLYVDRRFKENYDKAQQLSLPVGVYWFSHAMSIKEAEAEADYFYTNVLKGRRFELPVYIDVEHQDQLALGRDKLTAIVKAWCERLEAKGFWVGIYSSTSFFATYMHDNELQGYAHWVAQWDKECTYKGKDGVLGMWQFGGEINALRYNKVAGVVCDQNYMLVDYPALIEAQGRNGFAKKTPKPAATSKPAAPKPTAPAEEVYTVKKGDTLSAIASKYGTTYQALAKYNGIADPNVISIGQKIRIPSEAKTTAKQIKVGDTVRVKEGAKTYTGGPLAYFVTRRDHKVAEVNGDRVVITYGGVVVAAVKASDLTLV